MIRDKKIGMHCSFLNSYVPVHIKYYPDDSKERSCEFSNCNNTKCNLNDNFTGDRSKGRNYLDDLK